MFLCIRHLEYETMKSLTRIVKEPYDLEVPRDLAELVELITSRGVADGASEVSDLVHIASGVHTMSRDVSISIQDAILAP